MSDNESRCLQDRISETFQAEETCTLRVYISLLHVESSIWRLIGWVGAAYGYLHSDWWIFDSGAGIKARRSAKVQRRAVPIVYLFAGLIRHLEPSKAFHLELQLAT